jgi:hypothetical protein
MRTLVDPPRGDRDLRPTPPFADGALEHALNASDRPINRELTFDMRTAAFAQRRITASPISKG